MKRVLIVSILLPCMFAISIRSMFLVDRVENNILRMTENMIEALDNGQTDRLLAEVEALQLYWLEEKAVLGHYVRHNQMEALGQCIARLPAYIRNEETWSDFQAELAVIEWQIRNMKHTEIFDPANIL